MTLPGHESGRTTDAFEARLREIEARLQAATPGPWKVCRYWNAMYNVADCGAATDGILRTVAAPDLTSPARVDDTARFIANAPDDIAWLLAELRAARSGDTGGATAAPQPARAPGAEASTPPSVSEATPQQQYEALLARKEAWFAEAAKSDLRLHEATDNGALADALGEIRHFAPAAMHWALNLASDRLLRSSSSSSSVETSEATDTVGPLSPETYTALRTHCVDAGLPDGYDWLALVQRRLLAARSAPSGDPGEDTRRLWRWAYALNIAAAVYALRLRNAELREAGEPNNWPAQSEWNELNGSSHMTFLRAARDLAGIDHTEFLPFVRGVVHLRPDGNDEHGDDRWLRPATSPESTTQSSYRSCAASRGRHSR